MSQKRLHDSEHLQRVRSGWASADQWLDEALAETFPASDPVSWGHEARMPTELEATLADRELSAPQSTSK